jgi:hypothetical protein
MCTSIRFVPTRAPPNSLEGHSPGKYLAGVPIERYGKVVIAACPQGFDLFFYFFRRNQQKEQGFRY